MIILTILGWLLLVLLVAVILLLVTPVFLRARLSSYDAFVAEVEYRPGGRYGPRLFRIDSRKFNQEKQKSEKPAKKKRRRRRKEKRRGWRPGLESVQEIAAEIPRLIENTLGKFHIHRLRGEFSFGLGDPAETGRLYGHIASVSFPLQKGDEHLLLRPDFNRIGVHGSGEVALSFVPITLTFPAIRFGWKVLTRWR